MNITHRKPLAVNNEESKQRTKSPRIHVWNLQMRTTREFRRLGTLAGMDSPRAIAKLLTTSFDKNLLPPLSGQENQRSGSLLAVAGNVEVLSILRKVQRPARKPPRRIRWTSWPEIQMQNPGGAVADSDSRQRDDFDAQL